MARLAPDREKARERQRRYKEAHPERVAASNRKWQEANKDRVLATAKRYRDAHREERNATLRAYAIKQRYGFTMEEYEAILARGCAICGTHEKVGLDHDHATGKVRDALCSSHNSGLARFQDDPELLEKAARYLREHRNGNG